MKDIIKMAGGNFKRRESIWHIRIVCGIIIEVEMSGLSINDMLWEMECCLD